MTVRITGMLDMDGTTNTGVVNLVQVRLEIFMHLADVLFRGDFQSGKIRLNSLISRKAPIGVRVKLFLERRKYYHRKCFQSRV